MVITMSISPVLAGLNVSQTVNALSLLFLLQKINNYLQQPFQNKPRNKLRCTILF